MALTVTSLTIIVSIFVLRAYHSNPEVAPPDFLLRLCCLKSHKLVPEDQINSSFSSPMMEESDDQKAVVHYAHVVKNKVSYNFTYICYEISRDGIGSSSECSLRDLAID